MAKPSIARIVHYWTGGRCRAAIITDFPVEHHDEESEVVGIQSFDGGGINPTNAQTVHDEPEKDHEPADGTWHWPERV